MPLGPYQLSTSLIPALHPTDTLTPYQWHLRMTAIATTKKTPIMLTSHDYWNLDGYQNPSTPLALNYTFHAPYAKRRIDTDGIQIPTGKILKNKKHDVHDWTTPKQLGKDLASPGLAGSCGTGCVGYDNCYLTDRDSSTNWRSAPVATLASPFSGIQVDIFTDQAALQLYTCNNMKYVVF